MTRILNAVKLDFRTGRFYLTLYPLLFLVALLIGSVAKMPIFTVVLTIILAVFIAGGVFSINERNHGEKLYGTLPLQRRDVVLGRYVYGMALGIGGTIVAGLLGFLASKIAGVGMGSFGPNRGAIMPASYDGLLFWGALGAAFLYFCFALGVAFPIYYYFGFSKSYVFTMLPLYLVVLITLLITRKLNLTLGPNSTIQWLADHTYWLPIFGVVGGLILVAISIVIATSIYSHKEI